MINNKDEIDRLFPKETIESQIWDFLLRSSGNLMSKPIRESGFGPKKISLVSELDFFRFGLKMIEETSQAHPLIELNSMGCWVLPYKQICFVSGPPTVININASGQLHNPNGYAVEYLDGWGFYACNGITGSTKDAVLVPNTVPPYSGYTSNANIKYITLGTTAVAGTLYVRIGLPSTSSKSFGAVTLLAH